MIKLMEKGNLHGKMAINTKANGKIIKDMDLELVLLLIIKNMKETFKMIRNMDKE